MIKTKGILAIGAVLLFMGVAISPVMAQSSTQDCLKVSTLGDLQTQVQLSENDLITLEKFLPALLEKMQSATSYSDLIGTIQNYIKEYGRHPFLVLLLQLVIKVIHFNYNFNQLRPVRKTAFVMSWGFTNKLIPLGIKEISIAKPLTAWYYSGRSNLVLNSRTIIIDPYPFSIRTLTGRQIGIMTNFVGVYIHRYSSFTNNAQTFFFGYAGTVRGFDLSPFHG